MRRILLVILLLTSNIAQAHPVIFKGGIAATAEIRPQYALTEVSYTLHRQVAAGITYSRLNLTGASVSELQSVVGQFNALLWRLNSEHSQANFYLLGGGGYGYFDPTRSGGVVFMGAQADFETQRFYSALKFRANWTHEVIPYHVQVRVGLAPYQADYSELNTWLVLQVDHAPLVLGQISLSPLLRFFYKSALWEIGASTTGDFFLKLMTHF